MTGNDFKQQAIERGLRVGQKIRSTKKEKLKNDKEFVVIVTNGIVTGLYPHIFTVDMTAKRTTAEGYKNTIKTSFLYLQVINGEVELCK